MTDTGPLFVSSGDLIADRRYKWAIDQAARGDFAAAADILAQTVEIAPAFATAWFALGAIRDQLGDRSGAIAAFEKPRDADPDDYHGARLQLARLGSGETTPAMSEAYVRRLFDQYAARFDTALTERLAYRGPAGVSGRCFLFLWRGRATEAKTKHFYDRLVTGELAAFLKGELDKGERYDL